MKKIFILTGEASGDKLASTVIEKIQKGNNDIKIFIDEEHRIFNEEIYLFDHPEFGILFSINKI